MRFMYIAGLPVDFRNLDGVPKKVLSHVKAFSKYYDVDLFYYFDGFVRKYETGNCEEKCVGPGNSKLHVLEYVRKYVKDKHDYAGVYIRYPKTDPWFILLLRELKRNSIPIVVEIPTYPYDMEGMETTKGKIIAVMDRVLRNLLKVYVDRIVTYSRDEYIFGIKTINTINGIDFDKTPICTGDIDVDKEIKLIAVSAMYRVHGYERIIEGLHQYYQNGGNRSVQLHLVGKGDEYPRYEELTKKMKMEKHVVFHGSLFGEDLAAAYNSSAVGINSLAIHRQGLVFESTLKTREYGAKGLPMVSSSYVDAFDELGNENYVLRIPADESPVDISKLVAFVDNVYHTHSIDEVRRAIRDKAREKCDIEITMKPVIDHFMKGI